MMIDTETRLCGEAANEFRNMLTSVDLNSINARDEFISDVSCQFDEQGVMSIDISDLDIDLSIMDEDFERIDAIPVSKREEVYVGAISVLFLPTTNVNMNISNEGKSSYMVDGFYASKSMYSVDQSVSIKFAA